MLWGKGSPNEPPINLRAKQPEVRTVTVVTVLRIAVGVAAIAVVAWFGWHKYTEHQTTEQIKQLAATTEQSMQHYFDTDSGVFKYRVKVLRVDLTKLTDNKFEGVATVNTAYSSVEHLVNITVTDFGERTMWQAQPGAFLFLAQEAVS